MVPVAHMIQGRVDCAESLRNQPFRVLYDLDCGGSVASLKQLIDGRRGLSYYLEDVAGGPDLAERTLATPQLVETNQVGPVLLPNPPAGLPQLLYVPRRPRHVSSQSVHARKRVLYVQIFGLDDVDHAVLCHLQVLWQLPSSGGETYPQGLGARLLQLLHRSVEIFGGDHVVLAEELGGNDLVVLLGGD